MKRLFSSITIILASLLLAFPFLPVSAEIIVPEDAPLPGEIQFDESLNLSERTQTILRTEYGRLRSQGDIGVTDALRLYNVYSDLPEEEREKIGGWVEENFGVNPNNPISFAGAALGALFTSDGPSLLSSALASGDESSGSSSSSSSGDKKQPISIGNPLDKTFKGGQRVSKSEVGQDLVGFTQARLGSLIRTMLSLLAAVSVIPIVIGGVQLIISQGGDMVAKGKKTLFWGIVGLLIGLSGVIFFDFLIETLFIE